MQHEWAQGDVPPTLQNRWMVGAFVRGKGVYTLLEGGQHTQPDDSVAETYLRNALMLRGLGRMPPLQFFHGYSLRPENSSERARLNAATEIRLVDRKTWETIIGAGVGGLLPGAGQPGAFDAAGSLAFHHKYYREQGENAAPFKTGMSLGSMWRPEDPFRAESSRLFSLSGKLCVLDMVILSFKHHRIQAGAGAQPGQDLPTQDARLMLMLGPGIWRWK